MSKISPFHSIQGVVKIRVNTYAKAYIRQFLQWKRRKINIYILRSTIRVMYFSKV